MRVRRLVVIGLGAAMLLACSGCVRVDLQRLASDAADGRDNGTAGSVLAQDYILDYLRSWTSGPNAGTGDERYKQAFAGGTNLIGVLPGTDLADEYVLVGAHFDHVGHGCEDLRPNDDICNGATDNAAGVVAVLDVLRKMYYGGDVRRSVIFAFWDREEDGLLGARHYAQNPIIPLADTVAYVNLDIQGSNVRPSLRNVSFAVGAETGGPRMRQLVSDATAPGQLGLGQLSVIFGQGRSDHVPFIAAGVPSVFFTDATGPCYHTDSDDIDVVDFAKLDQQIGAVLRLTRALAETDDLPTFTTGLPIATYDDAAILYVVSSVLVMHDLDTFNQLQADFIVDAHAQLQQIILDGPEAFDSTDASTMLQNAAAIVSFLATGPCDGYLTP
ncbi:MAG TPA: M28 family peptidase [Acidimicrobiia bacterium]|nr:M28 family peptidase [Acidimicrobiia bacterium]